MKKAVFFDVDGTLIDAGAGMPTMSEPTKQAIRRLQAAGHYTFIASGRPYAFLDKELLEFGFDGYVLMNGAAVILDDVIAYKKPLDKGLVADICRSCEEGQVEYILQGTKHVYLRPEFKQLDAYYASFSIAKKRFVYEFSAADLDVYKMEFIAKDEAGKALCRSLAPAWEFLQDPRHKMKFELYARTETKASGIRHALEALAIPKERSYAFGDGENDREMLQAVGCSFAMDNAKPRIKALADHTVASVQQDGVAQGILEYIL